MSTTNTPKSEIALVEGKPKRIVKGTHQGPLPDAGHARDEELKRRRDDLLELAAKLTAAMEESGMIDTEGPKFSLSEMSIENEIASRFDMLKVPGALEEYDYSWVNFASAHGLHVTAKQAQGWEVVCGEMPECKERKDELGRRRVGDVILMRLRKEHNLELRRLERARRRLQQEGVESAFAELGERVAGSGIVVHTQLTDHMTKRAMARAQAQQIAGSRFDSMLRDGSVPNLRPGR